MRNDGVVVNLNNGYYGNSDCNKKSSKKVRIRRFVRISFISFVMNIVLMLSLSIALYSNVNISNINSSKISELNKDIQYYVDENSDLKAKLSDKDHYINWIESSGSGNVSKFNCVSYDDIIEIAKLVSLESSGKSYESQVGIARVVLNRLELENYPDTISEIINQDGQFSSSSYINDVVPKEENISAVVDALNNTCEFPLVVDVFSYGEYTNNPLYNDFCCIDDIYFSISSVS